MRGCIELLSRSIAHRGLHGGVVPENSCAAVEVAVQRGMGVEIDVRLSADGTPMVFHDATLVRMCGRPGKVAATSARELSGLRLAGTDERMPSLAAVMSLIGGRAPVLVDLKPAVGQRRALLDAVAILLRCYRGPVAAVTFDPLLLSGLRERAPRLLRGQSAGVDPRIAGHWWGRGVCTPIDDLWALRVADPHFVTYNVDRMPSPTLKRLRRRLPVAAWTVRTPQAWQIAREHADVAIVEGEAVALALRPVAA